MSRFTIYSITGTAKTEIEVLELHDEWMAECFVTVTVKSEEPIDFVIGDYIIYRDEKYAIDYDPTVIKKARRGSYGEGFVYDNIKFAHDAQSKIVRCDFTDIVLSPDSETNKIHYSSLPTFPFYCASVDDLLDRVQACLEELYLGQFVIIGLNSIRNKERGQAVGRRQEFIDAYKKYIDPAYIPSGQEATDPYGKQDVAETVDNISCWDALVKIHDDFDLNFIQRGYVVVAGTNGALTASTFRYGKGNGLYELERISDSSKQIVTRLRGYGNETNLPSRYYATLNMQVFANALVAANGMVTVNLKYRTDYFLEVSPAGESILTTKIGDTEYPNSAVRINGLDGNVIVDTRTSVPIAAGTKIYFLDGVKKDAFPTENRDYSTNNLPDNMAVSRLMLPGFPNQSLADWVEAHKDDEDKDWLRAAITAGFEFSTNQYRPYIDSPNKEEYEIRPASIYFDGSDETDDIYPTIEEMEYQGHRIDQVVEAEQITDNGVFTKEGDIPNFKITLPDLGFNLLEYYEDGASIDMKSGMCGARSFEFAKKPTRDAQTGHWICTVKRVHDDALDLWFPYNDFQIRPNDKYVLIGIDMPNAYVNAASVKLLKASLEALDENDEPQYTYQPRIDEIWMQRQHNNSIGSAITSIHDTIKAGDIFQFEDADLGVSDEIIIDVLTIKENGNNGIPTYEVTLRNEKQVSTIQKAVEKAVSCSSAVSGSAGGYSGRQVYNAIENYGSDFFLSKNTDDVANGEIGFLKGLWIKVKGLFGISEDGNALLHDADMSGKVHVGEDLNVEGEILGTSAVLDEIRSSEYTGDGMLDTGYKLWYEEGRAKLVIDDLVARGKFTVNELEARKWTYAGGNMVFSGAGSTLFFVEYLDANENTLGYTNINSPWLLAGRPLLSAMVAWSKRRTVKRQLTDAEKAQVVKFRCYEYSDDGTMQTRNWWHVNDIAMCETLNKVKDKANSDGSYSGYASNTVYKRRVAGIGSKEIAVLNDGRVYDYVDLWNIYNVQGQTYINSQGQEATITDNVKGFLNMAPSGQTPSTDWPAAGDVIVQCGNPLDADRQAVVTIEVQGTLHGFKVYDTINDYSMANKEWVEIGYDQTTGKAKSNIYGDFRFGCRENEEQNGGSYVKYNRTTKQLDIKANVRFMSPATQQETTLNDFATSVVGELGDLQQQIDGEIDTWFYNGEPGPTVLPESDWVASDTQTHTNNERLKHLGDLYYDNSSGYAYRYSNSGTEQTPVFYWNEISDSAVIKALENAAKAQDTADHKRRVFLCDAQNQTPAPPYDPGDLWVNVKYPWATGATYNNEILKCDKAVPRTEGGQEITTFSINDWSQSNGYTSKLNNFVTYTYAPFVQNIQGQVDKKAETFRQATDPADSWTDAQKPNHVGDIWMDISDEGGKKTYIYVDYGAGADPRYDWQEQDVPDEVFDEIDGKAAIYTGWNDWIVDNVSQLQDKDLFIPNADVSPSGSSRVYKANKVYRWKAATSTWEEIGYTDNTELYAFMNGDYARTIETLTQQVDKKAETWRQADDPSDDWYDATQTPVYDVRSEHVGDLWMDISQNGGNKTYIYVDRGAEADPRYDWEEQAVPDEVFDEIDGKAEIFVEKPTDYCARDMWIIESDTTTCPDTDLPTGCQRGDIVVADNMPAGTTKREGTYVKGDWRKKDRYTDDTKANQVALGLAKEITDRGQAVAAAQAAAAQDATNKVNAASQQLTEAINAVDNAHSTAEGALEDGYIDNDEREALKAVLKSLDAEFTDVTASYSVVYGNSLLNGTTQKTALYNAYTALVSAHDAYDAAFTSFIDAPDTTKYEKGDSEGDYTYTPEGAQEAITVNLTTLQTTFNTCASTYQTALENANAKIQDKIKEIADAATREIGTYAYIKEATKATSVTQGGLMLTSAIFLRQLKQDGDPTKDSDYTTWSGINGTTPDGQSSIAAWYGGDMIDYEGLTDAKKADGWKENKYHMRYAKTLFRMDGTGYMAGGKIHWDSNGDGFVANGNVAWTTTNGVTSVTINGATVQNAPSVNTQKLLLNGTDVTAKLNALFDMFEKDTTTQPGTTLIKAKYSLYSVGDVSALGASSGGGGGGGGGASALYECNDVKSDGSKVYGAAAGRVLTYGSDNKWYASDLSSSYLTKTNPVVTETNVGGLLLERKDGANPAGIGFKNTNGILGYLAARAADGALVRYNAAATSYYTIIDSSNIASQSVSSANGLEINSGGFTTGAAGWYKLAMIASTDPRGSVRIGLITVGGSFSPYYAELYVKNGWSNTDFILYGRFDYISKFRLTKDNTNTYIEGYFPTANTVITLQKIKDRGYVNDNGTGWTLYSSATAGSGTVDGSVCERTSLTTGIYSNKPIEASEGFVKTNSSNDYVLLGGGGHAAISDLNVHSALVAEQDSSGNVIKDTYLMLSGGTLTDTLNVATGKGISDATGPGLLVYKPTSWTGVANTQWGVGAYDVQGVIRSNNSDLIHYKGSTNYNILDSSNSSVSLSGSTLTVKINGTSKSLTNTWRGIQDNLTSSTNTTESLSAKQGYLLANGSARDDTKLPLAGGTMTGVLTLKGSQYGGYQTGDSKTYAMNANNSDILGVNAIIMSDKSDSWTESIGFPRDGSDAGHYDTFRAANGTFYFGFNGYYDSSNVEHAASELITMSGSTVKLERSDANNAEMMVKNSNGAVSLLTSTNRGLYNSTGSNWIIATNGTNTWMSVGKVGIGTDSPSQKLHVSGGLLRITNNSRTVDIGAQNSGAIHIYNDNNSAFFFNGDVCSNGVNAYDLGSSTYPWGSLYAAQCNIYGTAPSVHVGTSSSARISLHWSSDNNRGLYDYSGYWVIGANTNTFLMRGNVGIGTSSPSYKLHVNGAIYATGDVTAASDQRKKDFVEDIVLTLEQIANAPAVKFRWKDDRDSLVHIGTYAQYWQDILPESVSDRGGELGFTYGNTALVAVKNLARYVMQLEEEVRQLKNKQKKSA